MQTPVTLIIFNQPDTTKRVFEVIRQAKPTKLFVICDAPRPNYPGEEDKCMATRQIVDKVDWNCEVIRNYSDVNLGPKLCISSGLNWVFEQVDKTIVLEHDCLPHSHFFQFCEDLLEYYRDDERIMTISGNNFQFGRRCRNYSYYFSRYPLIWGWATWRRAWQKNDMQMQQWQAVRDSHLLQDLLQDTRAVKYWSNIFQKCYEGYFDTWDYPWTLTSWLQNGLSIVPNYNLVSNIGFSANALNTKAVNSLFDNYPNQPITFPLKHPPFIVRDVQADNFTQSTQFDVSFGWRMRMKLLRIAQFFGKKANRPDSRLQFLQ